MAGRFTRPPRPPRSSSGRPAATEIPFELDVLDPTDMAGADDEMVDLDDMVVLGDGEPQPVQEAAHDENLALILPEELLTSLGREAVEAAERDREARAIWDEAMAKGLEELGFDRMDDKRSAPFQDAFSGRHPVLAEAVVSFQARAIKELFPADGPVKTKVLADNPPPDLQAAADRIAKKLNDQVTRQCSEWRPEFDTLLMMLPLMGSAFKKTWWDEVLDRPRTEFVLPDDFLVPFSARDLRTAPRYTHVLRLYDAEVRTNQAVGLWRAVPLTAPMEDAPGRATAKAARIEGKAPTGDARDDRHQILEQHVDLVIPGLTEHGSPGGALGSAGEPGDTDGLPLPYILTVDKATGKVLALRRNWRQADPLRRKILYFTHYRYLPWMGFYGIGLWHVLGGIAKGCTGALRALMDSAAIENMPGGVRLKSKVSGSATAFRPLEWTELDAPASNDIRKLLMPWPTNGPSATLFQLLGALALEAKSFAAVATQAVSEANQNAPVGTTLALLEEGSQVYSAIHARLHFSQAEDLELLAELNRDNTDDPDFRMVGVAVVPVSDPKIFSQIQRAAQAQAGVQLAKEAQSVGVKVDLREAYVSAARTLDLSNVDQLFPPEPAPVTADAMAENLAVAGGSPLKAGPGQDHKAHIALHMEMLKLPGMVALPEGVKLVQHVLEHIAMACRAPVEAAAGFPIPAGQPLPPEIDRALDAAAQQQAPALIGQLAQLLQQAMQQASGAAAPGGQDIAALTEVEKLKVAQRREQAMVEADLKRQQMEIDKELVAYKAEQELRVVEAKLQADLQVAAAQINSKEQVEAAKLGAGLVERQAARDDAASREAAGQGGEQHGDRS